MISILTGDIINSRQSKPEDWIPPLTTILNRYGASPQTWEIYRGDSFQIEIPNDRTLEAAILIKATLKKIKNLDVRIAIGIGEKSYDSGKITSSNGSAFVRSGECFEGLKKGTLAFKSTVPTFDVTINLMLRLAALTMNHWTVTSAAIVKTALENPTLNQEELAIHLQKTQSTISAGLKRAGYDEISALIQYFNTHITY